MASPGGQEYDANLLASAPVATKAQLQSGYNPDILVEKPTPPPSRHDIEAAIPATNDTRDGKAVAYPSQKQPFYRTTKGLIVICVVVIIIIAAAVGGGVGGSKKKNKAVDTQPSEGQGAGAPVPASAPASASGSGSSTKSGEPASTTADGQNVGSPVTKSSTGPGVPITPTAPTPSGQAQQAASNAEAVAAQLIGKIVDGR